MAENLIDFKQIENKWRKFWEKEKIYQFDKSSKKKIFSIDTPPPYISGKMHMGHAFMYSQMDFIARFARMSGKNVFYPFGTDDNGLPTERFVEKINHVKSMQMSRAEFIQLCLKTLKETTGEFIGDWINLGVSCDYDIYYSTIDKTSQRISQKSFVELFKKGEIYKKKFPTLWCPECQTAIAQAELEDKEFPSLFSTLKFKVGKEDLLIATTRPELLGACVAVFVNPQDKRYKKFVGKTAKVPLFDFEVPILNDASAEIEKGTGVLMVCSYGDKYDAEAINRHNLKSKPILNEDGILNVKEYKGMKIKDARKKILEDLKKQNFIVEQKNISHVVNVHDKCGTEIEILETAQWFTKILDKKKILVSQGKKIKWHPEHMFKRYENWVNGLEWDWNISRNRHFGVPIPVWECKECGEIILPSEKELPVDPLQTKKKCAKCGKFAEGEKMVFDTWATSSLTPQIASNLVRNKITIPYSLRPQGHDIIRTWAFYTIVKSYLHEKKIPWEEIIVTGNVSLGGEKMSKSKGNIISPQEVLKKFNADALRFWAASSKLGGDLDYHEKDLVAGEKLIRKLLNASKFVFMNLEDWDGKKPKNLVLDDEEFLGKMNEVIKSCTRNFENYESSKAKQEIEQFFWSDFCDYYLESVKKTIYQNKEGKSSAQYTLYRSLLTILKMFAPITPFITEEIYQTHFKKYEKDKSIHLSKWPESGREKFKGDWEIFKKNLDQINQFKSQQHLPLNTTSGALVLPVEAHATIKNYEKRFLDASGARCIKVGKEFKPDMPEAGAKVILDKGEKKKQCH